jgi:plasmid stabilization system protein ParE
MCVQPNDQAALQAILPVIFTLPARAELIDAQDWYTNEAPDLGRRFRAAVDAVIKRMGTNPRQFPVAHKDIRRALLRHFPYALMFVIDDATLTVIACFHGSRDPAHWQKRA